MAHVIPDRLVRHIAGAAPGEARVVASRIPGSNPDNPTLVILCNALGSTVITDALQETCKAAKEAGDDERKEIFRSFGLMLTSAILGELSS